MDLSERFIIVTGANTGLGYETARALAAAGARVLLACRSTEKGSDAVRRILEVHPGANVAADWGRRGQHPIIAP